MLVHNGLAIMNYLESGHPALAPRVSHLHAVADPGLALKKEVARLINFCELLIQLTSKMNRKLI